MTNWQKQYDKGINKLLGEYDFPAVTSFLIAFSKDFIEKELYSQAKQEMIRRKKEKIMTAEATREFTRTQLLKEIEEKLCGKKSESIGNMSSEQTKERIRIILTTLNHSERRNAHSN